MDGPDAVVEQARTIAEELLHPAANAVDASGLLPRSHLDALAAAGLYGLVGPREAGGLDADHRQFHTVVETLAGGCLTTAFVWAQHHGAVRTVARSDEAVREAWLRPLCSGARRSGVAFGALRRPGPPALRAELAGDVLVLDGVAPFVTGWGFVDVVHVAARLADGSVCWALVDAVAGETLLVEPLALAAVGASATVSLAFAAHRVPASRVTLVEPFADWRERDRAGLRSNGSLALGVAGRCARLLDDETAASEVGDARRALDAADVEALPAARAGATALAWRLAARVAVERGGAAVLLGEDAQRLAREALFLLVFGQTSAIRAEQRLLLGP